MFKKKLIKENYREFGTNLNESRGLSSSAPLNKNSYETVFFNSFEA
jgi:hypothetical protein